MVAAMTAGVVILFNIALICSFFIFITFHRITEHSSVHSTPGSMSGLVRFIQHIALELGFFFL